MEEELGNSRALPFGAGYSRTRALIATHRQFTVRLVSATGYSSNARQSFYSEQSLEIAPEDQVFRLIMGYRASQAVGLAVELAIPDRVADRAKTAAEWAQATGSDEDWLHRFRRGLCALGEMTEEEEGK